MGKYLIKLTPLEYYFFGGENAFHFDENGESISEGYYAASLPLPPQTSVIGMLRYTVLEQSGLLNSGGNYTDTAKIAELIGSGAFNIEDCDQTFGKIKSVSPLFIVDKDGNRYIRTPLNHKAGEKTYTPFKMSSEKTTTSHGGISLPEDKEYDPKAEKVLSFVNISSEEIAEDLIETDERVGIKKESENDGFVRKCYCKLRDGYSFAVIAEFEDFDIKKTVCYMGREKSAFMLEAEKCDADFEPSLKSGKGFYYAWSDTVLKDKIDFCDFAVTEAGSLRVLKSSIQNGKLCKTRHDKYYSVIKAGSVFYGNEIEKCKYPEKFGLNYILNWR